MNGLRKRKKLKDYSRNNFVVVSFKLRHFCENLKNGSIDFFKRLYTRA